MLQHLTGQGSAAIAERAISKLLSARAEWFFSEDGGAALPLRNSELDLSVMQHRLIFSCWTEKGARLWRVVGWDWTGEKLLLQARRRMGAERALLELIPRASAKAIIASVAAAREKRPEKLAHIACGNLPGAKVERAALSPGIRRGQPGRYARIILRLPHERVGVTATVASSEARNVDALLSSALLWFTRLRERFRPPYIGKLWLVIERQTREAARQRVVLLRDELRNMIELYELDEAWEQLAPVRPLERKELWQKRLARFPPVAAGRISESVKKISAQAANAIDVVSSRHGETLRYHGLPFARARVVMDRERIWFGIEGSSRRLLDDRNREDWTKLLRDLEGHRHARASDQRHALYRASGEAWLESILRRDITRLDPGLIIAPLHAQFRTSHGGPTGARPIDLLALRQDGRLVVIELKVSEDREHVFQGVDYWRRVEAHRRRGHIAKAALFGDRKISDESPLVYLVAPLLRFHPSFATLARVVASDIEIYRFDINEDWRAGVRVMRRTRVN